ncbi:iron donor protein CyaY [Buchnera aphidicola (Takecallis taiwana)]|uniref:iron donor protein CyaY n=1 Tax=Buchnera aphidicola TaxID=9 RepID=UPI0031B67E23
MKLTKSEFHTLYNNILTQIENTLDHVNYENDLDYEINHHIMVISFSKKNKIIISKQESLRQIWLATKQNGYHFNYKNNNWICNRSKINFWHILKQACYLQGSMKITLENLII